jgi:hypothetical protein
MRQAGIWISRAERKRTRHRCEHIGELVQIDGSEHRWFEDRAAACTLLVFVDDATSRLMELRFVPSENTFAYFEALKAYLHRHGKPFAFYSNKHSIFRVSNENAVSGNGMTQFEWALSELNIEMLCANTSHAKGRVERAHYTLQDRLVKELRLAGISTTPSVRAVPGIIVLAAKPTRAETPSTSPETVKKIVDRHWQNANASILPVASPRPHPESKESKQRAGKSAPSARAPRSGTADRTPWAVF